MSILIVPAFASVALGADDELGGIGTTPDLRAEAITVAGTDLVKKWFVNSGQSITTPLTIRNDGPGAAQNPYLEIRAGPTLISCPRVMTTIAANGGTQNYDAVWNVPEVPNGDDAYAVTFTINPKTVGNGGLCAPTHIDENAVPDSAHPTQTIAADDNSISLILAVNRKPDLRIAIKPTAEQTVRWCGNANPSSACTLVAPGSLENQTAYVPSGTHFKIEITNGDPSVANSGYWKKVYQANSTSLTLPGGRDTGATGACPDTPNNAATDGKCVVYLQFRVREKASPGSAANTAYFLDTNTTDWTAAVGSCGTLNDAEACPNFDLLRAAGNYTLTVNLDPNNVLPDATYPGVAEARTFVRDFQVRFAELGGAFDFTPLQTALTAINQWQTDEDGVPILPTDGTLRFNFTVRNHGGAGAIAADRAGIPVVVRTFILNPKDGEAARELPAKQANSLATGGSATFNQEYVYSSDTNQGNYLRGGRIILRAVIDMTDGADTTGGQYAEQCEFTLTDTVLCGPWQNVVDIPFKIRDSIKPTVVKWGVTKGQTPTQIEADPANFNELATSLDVRKKAPLNFTIVVADNDEVLHTATDLMKLNLTVDGVKTSYTFPAGVKHGPNFWFTYQFPQGLDKLGAYSVEIEVKDSFENRPATTPASKAFAIVQYAVQTKAEDLRDCGASSTPQTPNRPACDPTKFWVDKPFLNDLTVGFSTWEIRIGSADTGIPDAKCDEDANPPQTGANCAVPVQKKWITLTKPSGASYFTAGRQPLTSGSGCSTDAGSRDPPELGQNPGTCNTYINTDLYRAKIANLADLGVWRSVIEIEDAAGDVRKLYWNFTVRDNLPTIGILSVPPEGFSFTAGAPALISVEVTDESGEIDAVRGNWSKGATKVPLAFGKSTTACGTTPTPPILCSRWDGNFGTGWKNPIDEAGTWRLDIDAKEGGGARLNASTFTSVVVRDVSAPTISVVKASAREEEKGYPVTWEVIASDETEWTVKLFLTNAETGQTVQAGGFDMSPPDATGKSTFSKADLEIGSYTWTVTLTDSVGNVHSSATALPLAILSNTAPRAAILTPSIPAPVGEDLLQAYFSPKRPKVEALVHDNDGVNLDTVKVFFGETAATLSDVTGAAWIRPNANPAGFLVTYNHTAEGADTASFILRIRAADNSNPVNEKAHDFRLVIDGRAPESQAPTLLGPKYRGTGSLVWNVTLDTVFKIEALDPAGSGVALIEYRLDNSATWIPADSSGFRLPSNTIHRLHVLKFRARDRVDNIEADRRIDIWVDTEAPEFNEDNEEVDERSASFTITDYGTGVEKASVLYKINTGDYVDLPLVLDEDGRWIGSFPTFKRDDIVRLYATATDYLGNTRSWGSAASPALTIDVNNSRPVVELIKPVSGSTVSGPMVIEWEITDVDGDDTELAIKYAVNGTADYINAAVGIKLKRGTYEFDTTQVLDGNYVFRLSAWDGHKNSIPLQFDVTIRNAKPPIDKLDRSGSTEIGSPMVITAAVTKKDVISVLANITLDGVRVATGVELNDKGELGDVVAGDRLYAVTFVPDGPGRYTVEVVAKYREGGEVKEYKKVTEFNVQASSIWVVQDNPALIAAIALFGLGVVGVAAWGLLRRWA